MSDAPGATDGDAAPREIELKLDCAGSDLNALTGHPLLHGANPNTERLVSTYFDTPARDLREAGLTLRVRAKGDRHVQTVKAGEGGVGLFDRGEWETGIAGAAPDPSAWADTPAAEMLARAEAPLGPLFSTEIERTIFPVEHGASRILVTLDQGRITCDGGEAPLCEVELEVESGRAADLFALAQTLAETVPLRLGILSKSARGFALLDGRKPEPSKAEPIALPKGADTAEVFRRVARSCLHHLRLNETAFLEGFDPDALHQMRVSLRRLRSALSLFEPLLEADPRASGFSDEIKRVTEPFGHARNLDVFLAETLPRLAEEHPDDPALEDLRTRIGTERESAYDAVLAILQSAEWRGLLLDMAGWIEAGAWAAHPAAAEDGRDFAARVLERARRRVKKRGRGLKNLDAETRHRARIAGKKLRYGADFFGDLFTKKRSRRRRKAFGSALSDLQDHLGVLNDLETARTVTAELAGPGGPDMPAPDPARTDDLLTRAAEARGELLDVKPFWRR